MVIYNCINLILVKVERKSLIRKTLILIRVPFVAVTFSVSVAVTFSVSGVAEGRGLPSSRSKAVFQAHHQIAPVIT